MVLDRRLHHVSVRQTEQSSDKIQPDMNPNIAKLAQGPRARKWRSRLIPYDAYIKRMRQKGASFESIATWISDRGLSISRSGVHAYVQARIRRGDSGYELLAIQSSDTADAGFSNKHSPGSGISGVDDIGDNAGSLENEYVYKAMPREGGLSADEDMSFNNPLD